MLTIKRLFDRHLCVATSQHLGRKSVSYIQGQSPSRNVREYFYYIDHQGQVLIAIVCAGILELRYICGLLISMRVCLLYDFTISCKIYMALCFFQLV